MTNSWKPVVQTDDSGKWYDNALRFETQDEALAWARELSFRWISVREHGAQESDDPVAHRLSEGKLEHIE